MNTSAIVAAELGRRLVVPEHGGVPLTALTGFLLRTFEVVPAGRESEFTDIDGELNDMLRWT
jgi:hypothetical protein